MVKNLIFDVGMVLLDYRWKEMLVDIRGLDDERAELVGSTVFDPKYWDSFDSGNITIDELIRIQKDNNPDIADDLEWFLVNRDLMQLPRPKIYDQMRRLKDKGYQIYILSNYSKEFFEAHTNGAAFWPYIDGRIVSYEVHCLKPHPEIYKCLLDKYDLNPSECIFFDDLKANIDGAKAMGIDGIQITSEKVLSDALDEFLSK